jgi:hypothetical protein
VRAENEDGEGGTRHGSSQQGRKEQQQAKDKLKGWDGDYGVQMDWNWMETDRPGSAGHSSCSAVSNTSQSTSSFSCPSVGRTVETFLALWLGVNGSVMVSPTGGNPEELWSQKICVEYETDQIYQIRNYTIFGAFRAIIYLFFGKT